MIFLNDIFAKKSAAIGWMVGREGAITTEVNWRLPLWHPRPQIAD